MLRCRDGSLYTGTAADLCRRMRQHAGGGSACARYTRAHPPRELAGVWRTERQGDALRLEYAVKHRLDRQGKEALLACPARVGEVFPHLAAFVYTPLFTVTWEDCLEGRFDG